MLLKKADDESKRVALLEDLQKSTLLDSRQKKSLREELGRLRKGIQGEQESAYYLDQYFEGSENHEGRYCWNNAARFKRRTVLHRTPISVSVNRGRRALTRVALQRGVGVLLPRQQQAMQAPS